MEEEEVLWLMVFLEGTIGALGDGELLIGVMGGSFGNGSSSGCHGGLWWLIEDEEDGEVSPYVKIEEIDEFLQDLTSEWDYEDLTKLLERECDEFVLNHEGDKNDARVISLKSDLTIKV
ncbi:hypothetical protein Tco_0690239 [Tanacetum coccineum]